MGSRNPLGQACDYRSGGCALCRFIILLPRHSRGGGRAHHLRSHSVGLTFIRIVGRANGQLRLYGAPCQPGPAGQQLVYGAIASGALELQHVASRKIRETLYTTLQILRGVWLRADGALCMRCSSGALSIMPACR